MSYINEIKKYRPINMQEEQDKKNILKYVNMFADNILLRENEFAHITSSAFIVNKQRDKALMIYHNIIGNWAWTGGHADGESDLLYVALKEAKEETGINQVKQVTSEIISLDILAVFGHMKNGSYVSGHQHLSAAYLCEAEEEQDLFVKPDENSAVKWLSFSDFSEVNFSKKDLYLYNKLITRAKTIR